MTEHKLNNQIIIIANFLALEQPVKSDTTQVHASPEIVKGGWLHYGEYNGEIYLNSRNDEYKIFKYMGI